MIKVTIWTDNLTNELTLDDLDKALKLRTKIQSQMNNGHTILFGNNLINPKYVRAVSFERIVDEEVNNDQ